MIRMGINAYGDVTLGNGHPIGQVKQNAEGRWEAIYEDEYVRDSSGCIPALPTATDAAVQVWSAFMGKSAKMGLLAA